MGNLGFSRKMHMKMKNEELSEHENLIKAFGRILVFLLIYIHTHLQTGLSDLSTKFSQISYPWLHVHLQAEGNSLLSGLFCLNLGLMIVANRKQRNFYLGRTLRQSHLGALRWSPPWLSYQWSSGRKTAKSFGATVQGIINWLKKPWQKFKFCT